MKEITFKQSDTVRVIAEIASYIDSLKDDKEYTLTAKEGRKREA
mgnify:CR=1 FL=1